MPAGCIIIISGNCVSLVDTKLLSESMLAQSQMDTEQKSLATFYINFVDIHESVFLKLLAILPRSQGVGKNEEECKAYVNILNISLEDRG